MELNSSNQPTAVSKREYWQVKMNLYKASNLTQRTFCEEHDLSYTTFTYWRSRLSISKKGKAKQEMHPIKIKPSKVMTLPQCFRIKFPNGVLLEFPSTLDEESMQTLFKSLGVKQ